MTSIISGDVITSKNYFNSAKTDDDNKAIINIDKIMNCTDEIGIILDKTMCYSLEGGQISDKGGIRIKNLLFNVENVRKVNGYVIHFGHFTKVDPS